LHLTYLHRDAASIAESWREDGVTHVLLYQLGLEAIIVDKFDPVTPRDLAILSELRASEMEEVSRLGKAYTLYRLEPAE
jgi:hypothetical protein